MRLTRRYLLAISATAGVALLATSAPQASAQTLMDLLRGKQRQVQSPHPAPPASAPVQPVLPPRVKGPSYYDYKTDKLVRVDFLSIRPEDYSADTTLRQGAVDPRPVGSTARNADGDDDLLEAVEAILEEETGSGSENASILELSVEKSPKVRMLTDDQIAALQEFELLAEKETAEAIVAYYSKNPSFIWVSDDGPNESAHAALRALAAAGSHGLNPADYMVDTPSSREGPSLAAFEMELSARILRYVRDARSGRVDPNRISGYHDFKAKELDLAAVLGEAAASDDLQAFLEKQHPVNQQYQALRRELAELRRSEENEIVIASRTLIRPGQSNPEFSKLLALIDHRADEAFRAAHGELLVRSLGTDTYSLELVPLIKAAQKSAGVGDDGVIGARTIQAIAGESRAARIEKVEIAMERLRWLPSDLSARYVFINTPAFEATYVEDGEEKLSMRTVVGALGTQTYFFQDEIDYVEFHPYWGVPRSILINKYLPKLYSDPSYLDRNGFEVVNSRGQTVPSASVNWAQYGGKIPYDVRQKPGRGNALGEMKIMFPNAHAIYMHDTPDKHLFDRDNRALSNGCVRLADPRAMAAAVLGWERSEVEARLKRPHSRENLATKVPVYVSYFTAWPDGTGKVEYFNDTYARDEKVRKALDKINALRMQGV